MKVLDGKGNPIHIGDTLRLIKLNRALPDAEYTVLWLYNANEYEIAGVYPIKVQRLTTGVIGVEYSNDFEVVISVDPTQFVKRLPV